jgi:nitrate reductase molybdenum cofactor assembly chaperone NarJ/NarW
MERKDSTLEALASCIEYPSGDLLPHVERTVSVLKRQDREAGRLLDRFRTFLASVSLESAEEMHAQIFDLEPGCCLYVGYHLFGDSHRRGIFMAHLAEWYESTAFSVLGELPDHLAVLLRFLARVGEGAEKSELVEYCLLPALATISRGLNGKKSPYEDLVAAIRMLVNRERGGRS